MTPSVSWQRVVTFCTNISWQGSAGAPLLSSIRFDLVRIMYLISRSSRSSRWRIRTIVCVMYIVHNIHSLNIRFRINKVRRGLQMLTLSGCCLRSWEKPLAEKSWLVCGVRHWLGGARGLGLWSLTLNGITSLSVTWARLAPPAWCRYLSPTLPTASGVRQTNKWVEEHLLKLRGYQH